MIGSLTATLLDLMPVLRKLPDFVLPIKQEGKQLHQQEMRLFKGLFLDIKKGMRDNTSKVSI
jgi:hypothetical protein